MSLSTPIRSVPFISAKAGVAQRAITTAAGRTNDNMAASLDIPIRSMGRCYFVVGQMLSLTTIGVKPTGRWIGRFGRARDASLGRRVRSAPDPERYRGVGARPPRAATPV